MPERVGGEEPKPAVERGPVIRIHATYPGANAHVVADTVAAPIEHMIDGTEGLLLVESELRDDGDYLATVRFRPKTDVKEAIALLRKRVAVAEPALPEEVRRQRVTIHRGDFHRFPRLWVAVVSPDGTRDAAFLQNHSWLKLKDELARVPGVADIRIPATPESIVQVWLDPPKLKARKLTVRDVVAALQLQNLRVAAAKDGVPHLTGTVAWRPVDAARMESLILSASPEGEIVRLKDVGKVEVGPGDAGLALWNGRPVSLIAITPASGLDIEALRKALPGWEKLPKGMKVELAADLAADSFAVVELHLPDGVRMQQTRKVAELAEKMIRGLPGAPESFAFAEREPNRATLLVKLPAKAIPELRNSLKDVKNVTVRVSDLTEGRPFPIRIALTDDGEHGDVPLREWANAVAKRLAKEGIAIDPEVEPGPATPRLYLNIDHDKAGKLGVKMDDIFTTLQATLGSVDVIDFNKFGRTSQVRVQGDEKKVKAEDIKKLLVRGKEGKMVSLGALLEVQELFAPSAIYRVNLNPALRITATAPRGKSIAETTAKCSEIAEEVRKSLKLSDHFKVVNLVQAQPR